MPGPYDELGPGAEYIDWLALIYDSEWGTYHFTMVDEVDEDGWVIRSHDGTGEAFNTEKAFSVGDRAKVNVLAAIRALPYPFATSDEAIKALLDWRAYECP
jgi:hypothetical protein